MTLVPPPSQLFLSLFLTLLPLLSYAEIDQNLVPFIELANANIESTKLRERAYINEIDKCWRTDPDWAKHRDQLALCSIGFCGKMKKNRGKNVTWYVVTDSSDDSSMPKPGTLRYAVNLPGKVWITFQRNMFIHLHSPLIISNYTTIDGRGAKVDICYGSGFLLYKASYVIIHNIHFHNIYSSKGSSRVVQKGGRFIPIGPDDGDAIRIVGGYRIWIDHNSFEKGHDGLIDVTMESTKVTISNNWFKDHDKVILLGHADEFDDRKMKVTLVYNRFGPHAVQRMPRIRYGYVHIANNLYVGWDQYCIGGGKNPTILSQGNVFIPRSGSEKTVIWKEKKHDQPMAPWYVRSEGDEIQQGTKFANESDPTSRSDVITSYINRKERANPKYCKSCWFEVKKAKFVHILTEDAGVLASCEENRLC